MSIKVGDRLPESTFMIIGPDDPKPVTTADIFENKRVVLFAVPGAFTPTCHALHMPGYVGSYDAFKKLGVDEIACTSTNDIFVLSRWARASGAEGKITMLADGNAEFARKLGLAVDRTESGFGERSHRYAMFVDDGVVKLLVVEPAPRQYDKASAQNLLSCMGTASQYRDSVRRARRWFLISLWLVLVATVSFGAVALLSRTLTW